MNSTNKNVIFVSALVKLSWESDSSVATPAAFVAVIRFVPTSMDVNFGSKETLEMTN